MPAAAGRSISRQETLAMEIPNYFGQGFGVAMTLHHPDTRRSVLTALS